MLRCLTQLRLILAISFCAFICRADTLNGAAQTNWNPNGLFANNLSNPALPYYWNNNSGDGPQANIGWCVVGGGECTQSGFTAPGYMPFYSSGGSGLPSGTMYFTSNGTPQVATLLLTLTNATTVANGVDQFGFYLTDSTGKPPSSLAGLIPMFNTLSNTNGSTFRMPTLAAGQNYGFYIENIQGAATASPTDYFYFFDSAANTDTGTMPADLMQHFAIFSGDGSNWFIGTEDADACQGSYNGTNSPCVPSSFFDFNNVVIELSPAIPEPATTALMGGGLLLLGSFIRRRLSN